MKISNEHNITPFTIDQTGFVTAQRGRGFRITHDGRAHQSFIYTVSGSICYHFLDGSREDMVSPAGTLAFLPAGTRHTSIYLEDETRVEIAQFDIITGGLPEYLSRPVFIQIDNAREVFTSFRRDISAGVGDNPLYFLYRIYELLWQVSLQMPKIPYKFKKLQTAVQEISLCYYENRKVADYAAMSGMSESGFRRLFTEYTGQSPIEHRNQIRLKEAQNLLRSGEYRVEETALAGGFSNLHFFCRSYKRRFGHSPGKEI